ncbi:MAG: rhodanese-like domain-containing protein [Bacteroidota bacterium]
MANYISRLLLINCISLFLITAADAQTGKTKTKTSEQYQCLPCGQDCDNTIYDAAGKCPHCQMPLVKKSTITFKNISPSEICDYISKHPATILLDVRTKEEFEGKANPNFGALKNAINIPVQELESKLSTISNLKKKEIIVYCSHNHRSPQASYILTQHGFHKIINMTGGMSVMKDNSCMK